jgi:hypothetical protein
MKKPQERGGTEAQEQFVLSGATAKALVRRGPLGAPSEAGPQEYCTIPARLCLITCAATGVYEGCHI